MITGQCLEQTAVLSEEQERAVDLVAGYCSQRPLPAHVRCL